jgi:hypothetical protein
VTAPRHIARYSPENTASEGDGRLRSPSFGRNFTPIRDALRSILVDREGTVLEIGSGTGQHIAHWAGEFPGLRWAPSDIHTAHHASIAAWGAALGCAPWAVARGLVRGAARVLAPGAPLILYGPFKEGGRHTGAGNAGFDDNLRAENPDWGVRDLDEVSALAVEAGFGPARVTRMPANNLLAAFARN